MVMWLLFVCSSLCDFSVCSSIIVLVIDSVRLKISEVVKD